jgi:hypothetical protein
MRNSCLPSVGVILLAATVAASPALSSAAPPDAETPASRACALVTLEEAATLLGPGAERAEGDEKDTCAYLVEGRALQLVLRIEAMQSGTMFLKVVRRPAMAEKGYTIQDEPSFGPGSFSARKADSLDFELNLKNGILDVGLRDEGGAVAPELLDKLRAVAKEAASRFQARTSPR